MHCFEPEFQAPDDPLLTIEDLRRHWLALVSPLGFGDRTLWMAFVGPDRYMQPRLTPMAATTFDDWMLVYQTIIGVRDVRGEHLEAGTTVAFLLARPGSGPVDSDDLHWADMVTEAARRHEVPIEPFFRANDTSVVEVSVPSSS
ncbi:hypothetical protein BH11ACT6_BH11ACT6_18170 [soil metagenome]